MRKNYVEMGSYYTNKNALVKTVCRATSALDNNLKLIAYAHVSRGGEASEIFVMPEEEFVNLFLEVAE